MTELKTLKDIESTLIAEAKEGEIVGTNVLFAIKDYLKDNWVDKKALRLEAIKWIKDLQKEKERCMPYNAEDGLLVWNQDIKISWIMHFFNIKEDELK